MGFLIGVLVVAAVVLVAVLYLSQIARSRRALDHLYDEPDDLRRADDNQQPPYNGSAGWV